MMLSKQTASVLVDLIENKLAMLQIGDREDLREVLTLQRCLSELKDLGGLSAPLPHDAIPHRGRHKKLETLMQESNVTMLAQRQTA